MTQLKKFLGLNSILQLMFWDYHRQLTKADVTDRNGAVEMILLNLNNLTCVKNMLFDSGYSGENFASVIKKFTVQKFKL